MDIKLNDSRYRLVELPLQPVLRAYEEFNSSIPVDLRLLRDFSAFKRTSNAVTYLHQTTI